MATPKNSDEGSVEMKIACLPTDKGWLYDTIHKYQGFWFEKQHLQGVFHAQHTFEPQPNDVILATFPKSGTTWFAALLFTIKNRTQYTDYSDHPLLQKSPQDCLRWMEFQIQNSASYSEIMSPVVKTHIPFTLLPESTKCASECPVIYVCRNPLDVFVSLWYFANESRHKERPRLAMEEAFDMYCQGVCPYGSYWDHVLEYWKASKEKPNQVMFVRYEDMKRQPISLLKKIASFVGCPFSEEEEQGGVIEKVVNFCSFESLASFVVNQDTTARPHKFRELLSVSNKTFFRKGMVGDYKTLLTDEMIERLKMITYVKFKGTGLDVLA